MIVKVTKQRIQYNGTYLDPGATFELNDSEASTLIQAELVEEVKKAATAKKEN